MILTLVPSLMNKSNPSAFANLEPEDRQRYLTAARQMTKFARDHAVPIAYAPPVRTFHIPLDGGGIGSVTLPLTLGKVETASGCVLQLESEYFIVTAEHVVEDFEKRTKEGEVLNWQVGRLQPFNPLDRIAWRGSSKHRAKDIIFIRMSEKEANEACANRTNIISASTKWPAPAPQEGETVLLAGYPTQLREVANGVIEPGSLSAMFRVTTSVGDGTFKCQYEYAELINFAEQQLPMQDLRVNVGGISGGPVFGVRNISYPFVGVISQRSGAFEEIDTIVIESVEDVPSRFSLMR